MLYHRDIIYAHHLVNWAWCWQPCVEDLSSAEAFIFTSIFFILPCQQLMIWCFFANEHVKKTLLSIKRALQLDGMFFCNTIQQTRWHPNVLIAFWISKIYLVSIYSELVMYGCWSMYYEQSDTCRKVSQLLCQTWQRHYETYVYISKSWIYNTTQEFCTHFTLVLSCGMVLIKLTHIFTLSQLAQSYGSPSVSKSNRRV